jgi:hypothetical protein
MDADKWRVTAWKYKSTGSIITGKQRKCGEKIF